ncbi:hypothetical protein [Candidatus Borrarchaeum sp.]|uniref:hypothetical protein n=1 Tax=Candidatus Borrarchaeum sp. TaxID=2846742 RepID=UPI00257A583C|nr:hypothetical protein [Candidatus Borrarchaeum sp.]
MKILEVNIPFDELPEEIQKKCRDSIKKEIKTTFTKDDDGWMIHCEFLGEPVQHKNVHDSELQENEIIEQFYAKDIEPELIDLLLSGQHLFPLDIVIRITQKQ